MSPEFQIVSHCEIIRLKAPQKRHRCTGHPFKGNTLSTPARLQFAAIGQANLMNEPRHPPPPSCLPSRRRGARHDRRITWREAPAPFTPLARASRSGQSVRTDWKCRDDRLGMQDLETGDGVTVVPAQRGRRVPLLWQRTIFWRLEDAESRKPWLNLAIIASRALRSCS